MNYKTATPLELISHIDEKYLAYKKDKQSRFCKGWTIWSTKMNTITRARGKKAGRDSNEADLLELVFAYWQTRSKQLELNYKKPFSKGLEKKKLGKEAIDIKKFIKEN